MFAKRIHPAQHNIAKSIMLNLDVQEDLQAYITLETLSEDPESTANMANVHVHGEGKKVCDIQLAKYM